MGRREWEEIQRKTGMRDGKKGKQGIRRAVKKGCKRKRAEEV